MVELSTIWNNIYPELINYNRQQQDELRAILYCELGKYTFEEKTECAELTTYDEDKKGYVMFFIAKQVEGLAPKSLKYYQSIVSKFIEVIPKPLQTITADDIRYYLAVRQSKDKVTAATMDNERRVLNSFFSWLSDEGYIQRNICSSIKKVHTPKKKKKAFTETDIAKIKDACRVIGKTSEKTKNIQQKRAIALVEFLLSTGCRVGEISALKREDIDLERGTAIVFGKGSKERTVYINNVSKLRLLEYWEAIGDNGYAFCSLQSPFGKWNVSGIEIEVREIGALADIKNCHPHRFRRTTATMAIKKGMSLLDVQRMLGHESAETTRIYLDLDDTDLKYKHEKYLG